MSPITPFLFHQDGLGQHKFSNLQIHSKWISIFSVAYILLFCVIYLIVSENKLKIDISSMRQGSQNYMGEVEHEIMWEEFKTNVFTVEISMYYRC